MLGGLAVVLHQAAGVAVDPLAAGPQPGPELDQPLQQLGPPPLQHAQPGVGRQVAGERQPQVEDPIVLARLALGRQQLLEEGLAPSVMPYTFLPRLPRPDRPFPGPEHGQLAAEGAGHRDGRAAAVLDLHRLHRAGALQPAQGRVQRPERHAAGRSPGGSESSRFLSS